MPGDPSVITALESRPCPFLLPVLTPFRLQREVPYLVVLDGLFGWMGKGQLLRPRIDWFRRSRARRINQSHVDQPSRFPSPNQGIPLYTLYL